MDPFQSTEGRIHCWEVHLADAAKPNGYLQTNLELGRVLLANLLGLEIHDVALDRYVEVAARLSPVLTLTIPIVTLDPTRTLT